MKRTATKKSIDSTKTRMTKNSAVLSLKGIKYSAVKKSLLEMTVLFLIIGLNWSAISAISGTQAYFHDVEVSPENILVATKVDFSVELLVPDLFRTQTQGGWSSTAKGDNLGAYRDANFDEAFSEGLVVGDNDNDDNGEPLGYHALFTSSLAIQEFLPTGGAPAPFTGNYEDPEDEEGVEAGVLAGQVVALTLNVGFDNYDEDFGVSENNLEDFYANSAEAQCEDMTVGDVLAEANLVLSGQSSEFSPSEISECVDEINNRFVDGEVEGKVMPGETVLKEIFIEKYEGLNFQHVIEVEHVSGDTDFCEALKVEAYLNNSLKYSGFLLDMSVDPTSFLDPFDKWMLYIGLDENALSSLSEQTCDFEYIISGWQENISVQGGGFSDIEKILDSVESGEWTFVEILSLTTSFDDGVLLPQLPNSSPEPTPEPVEEDEDEDETEEGDSSSDEVADGETSDGAIDDEDEIAERIEEEEIIDDGDATDGNIEEDEDEREEADGTVDDSDDTGNEDEATKEADDGEDEIIEETDEEDIIDDGDVINGNVEDTDSDNTNSSTQENETSDEEDIIDDTTDDEEISFKETEIIEEIDVIVDDEDIKPEVIEDIIADSEETIIEFNLSV